MKFELRYPEGYRTAEAFVRAHSDPVLIREHLVQYRLAADRRNTAKDRAAHCVEGYLCGAYGFQKDDVQSYDKAVVALMQLFHPEEAKKHYKPEQLQLARSAKPIRSIKKQSTQTTQTTLSGLPSTSSNPPQVLASTSTSTSTSASASTPSTSTSSFPPTTSPPTFPSSTVPSFVPSASHISPDSSTSKTSESSPSIRQLGIAQPRREESVAPTFGELYKRDEDYDDWIVDAKKEEKERLDKLAEDRGKENQSVRTRVAAEVKLEILDVLEKKFKLDRNSTPALPDVEEGVETVLRYIIKMHIDLPLSTLILCFTHRLETSPQAPLTAADVLELKRLPLRQRPTAYAKVFHSTDPNINGNTSGVYEEFIYTLDRTKLDEQIKILEERQSVSYDSGRSKQLQSLKLVRDDKADYTGQSRLDLDVRHEWSLDDELAKYLRFAPQYTRTDVDAWEEALVGLDRCDRKGKGKGRLDDVEMRTARESEEEIRTGEDVTDGQARKTEGKRVQKADLEALGAPSGPTLWIQQEGRPVSQGSILINGDRSIIKHRVLLHAIPASDEGSVSPPLLGGLEIIETAILRSSLNFAPAGTCVLPSIDETLRRAISPYDTRPESVLILSYAPPLRPNPDGQQHLVTEMIYRSGNPHIFSETPKRPLIEFCDVVNHGILDSGDSQQNYNSPQGIPKEFVQDFKERFRSDTAEKKRIGNFAVLALCRAPLDALGLTERSSGGRGTFEVGIEAYHFHFEGSWYVVFQANQPNGNRIQSRSEMRNANAAMFALAAIWSSFADSKGLKPDSPTPMLLSTLADFNDYYRDDFALVRRTNSRFQQNTLHSPPISSFPSPPFSVKLPFLEHGKHGRRTLVPVKPAGGPLVFAVLENLGMIIHGGKALSTMSGTIDFRVNAFDDDSERIVLQLLPSSQLVVSRKNLLDVGFSEEFINEFETRLAAAALDPRAALPRINNRSFDTYCVNVGPTSAARRPLYNVLKNPVFDHGSTGRYDGSLLSTFPTSDLGRYDEASISIDAELDAKEEELKELERKYASLGGVMASTHLGV